MPARRAAAAAAAVPAAVSPGGRPRRRRSSSIAVLPASSSPPPPSPSSPPSPSPPSRLRRLPSPFPLLAPLPLLLALLLLLLTTAWIADASFALTVESGTEECFVVRAPGKETSTISGNFDCLDDGLDPDPIRVTLYDSEGRRSWQSEDGAPEGTFSVSGVGRHSLCVANGHSDVAGDDPEDSGDRPDGEDRTVGFSVRVRPVSRGRELEFDDKEVEGPEAERAARLAEMADELAEDLEDLRDHQAYLKLREAAHRELTEQTFTRVVRWTAVEAMVLAAVAGGQVVYLRKFFEQRRFL